MLVATWPRATKAAEGGCGRHTNSGCAPPTVLDHTWRYESGCGSSCARARGSAPLVCMPFLLVSCSSSTSGPLLRVRARFRDPLALTLPYLTLTLTLTVVSLP